MSEAFILHLDQLLTELRASGTTTFRYRSAEGAIQVEFADEPPAAALPAVLHAPREPAPAPASGPAHGAAVSPGIGHVQLTQPGVGRLLCEEGRQVVKDETVALVVFDSIYLPVKAPVAGRIATVHVHDGQRVGFGDAIATIAAS